MKLFKKKAKILTHWSKSIPFDIIDYRQYISFGLEVSQDYILWFWGYICVDSYFIFFRKLNTCKSGKIWCCFTITWITLEQLFVMVYYFRDKFSIRWMWWILLFSSSRSFRVYLCHKWCWKFNLLHGLLCIRIWRFRNR